MECYNITIIYYHSVKHRAGNTMNNKISDSEIAIVESMTSDIQKKIMTHYIESGIPGGYIKASVLVPMTENVNTEFEIDVPEEMMDEDNTALLEYFAAHIYQPKDGEYMTESIHDAISQKERDLQKLQENLDNFDPVAFMADPDKYFAEHGEGSEPVDLLDTPIDGAFMEMVIGHDTPVKWEKINNKIHITGKVSVVDRETKLEYYIVPGTDIISIHVFAGSGTKKILRVSEYLVKNYGGMKKDWFHARGRCFVNIDNDQEDVDLHWYECPKIGSVGREIKEWYNMKEIKKTHKSDKRKCGVLTETGIVLETGETIKEGKVVDIARKGQKLLNDNKFTEFENLMYSSNAMNLSDDQIRLLSGTVVTDNGNDILDMLCHIEIMNSPDVPNNMED